MIFSSWQFILVFLPLALGGFFAIPARLLIARKLWLTAASLAFYGYWKLDYLPLIGLSVVFNYSVAEAMFRWHGRFASRWILTGGVGVNLLVLGYFKYADFFIGTVNAVSRLELQTLHLVLPLAISFFTFTQIAYLVDVYRDQARHYSFLDYTLFVVLFPHLISGPIVRHWEIIPQFASRVILFSMADLSTGLSIFLIGLYKKLLLADPVAGVANSVFDAAHQGITLTWFDSWLGTTAYALQIYFDFSGYSDMAIGLARMFSITFPCNFDSPYKSASIADFWHRWHITLTRFLREYLYFPLGGNRCSLLRQIFNILVVMLASGLWHGAGWTFVLWGGLHGSFLVIHNLWKTGIRRLGWQPVHWTYRLGATALTFVAVLVGWVLFRCSSINVAGSILGSMGGLHGFTVPFNIGEARLGLGKLFSHVGATIVHPSSGIAGLSYEWSIHGIALLLCIVWFLPNTQQLLAGLNPILEDVRQPARWQLRLNFTGGLLLGIPAVMVILSLLGSQPSPFLYFNF
jgi:D-alanyl-lipoteichoic acid acyltransferase DltB (MBOAT superfamily)